MFYFSSLAEPMLHFASSLMTPELTLDCTGLELKMTRPPDKQGQFEVLS